MPNDWNQPDNDTDYLDVLSDLRGELASLGKMTFTSDTNIPTGFIRWNDTNKYFEDYDGAAWQRLVTAEEERTNLELGDLAQEDTVNNSFWSGSPLSLANGGTNAQNITDARSNLGLKALAVKDTINNDNWSGADLSLANGGTGASDAAGARTALGLGSIATLSVVGNNDWDTTNGQELAVTNGGTGASDAAGARSALTAAKSGVNSDITAMDTCTSFVDANQSVDFGSNGAATWLTFKWDATNKLRMWVNDVYPMTAGGLNLGTTTLWFNGVNALTYQVPSTANVNMTLNNASNFDIVLQTGGVDRVQFSHSLDAWVASTDGGANLGTQGQAWNGITGKTFNFDSTTAASATALLGYINIQVSGVARKIPYYSV